MPTTHRPTARDALLGALACLIALVAVGIGAAWVPAVHRLLTTSTAPWITVADGNAPRPATCGY